MTARRRCAVLTAFLAVGFVAISACSGGDDESDADPASSVTPSDAASGTGTLPEGYGPGPEGSGLDRFYDQQVAWEACGSSNECGDIWVPLDYADPDGLAITIKAEVQSASSPSAKRGSLFINPGGPGGSGIDYLSYIDLDPSITKIYDVVGFDPRGVASSTPIDCLSDSDLDAYVAFDPSPDSGAEIQGLQDVWSHYTDGCQERSGDLLGHVSTVEVARDLDIIRSLVGDDKLSYFGASYGTYIGATYAGLFPEHVDRMVLDGAIDPLAEPSTGQLKQAGGFEDELTKYLEYCVDSGACPLGSDVETARDRLIQLLDDIDANPLPSNDGREVTEGIAFLGMIVPLYDRESWDIETRALDAALNGSGDVLLALSDLYTSRNADGSYSDNSMEVQAAVNCLDRPQDETLRQIVAGGAQFVRRSPVFGDIFKWFPYACSNWPLRAAEEPPDFSAAGAPPIVVVGTTRDPATPYQQAVSLANELDSGVLLSFDGDGHTAYGRGSSCIDDAINRYLVTGTPPADGTTC